MNDFVRCNKLSGVYWLQGPVDDIQIEIKLKPPDDIISLPKFEEYTTVAGDGSPGEDVEEFSLRWREKRSTVRARGAGAGTVLTYVNEEQYWPAPAPGPGPATWLQRLLWRMARGGGGGGAPSLGRMLRGPEDARGVGERCTAMHVLFDLSEYSEAGPGPRREAPLVTVRHDAARGRLVLSPAGNELDSNPYALESSAGEPLRRLYGVRVLLGGQGAGPGLHALARRLLRRWEERRRQAAAWAQPAPARARVLLTLEIASASGFLAGMLYVDYHIKLPAGAACVAGEPRGRTHAGTARGVACHYGHVAELCFELDAAAATGDAEAMLHVEVVSRDAWRRHRTEGYARARLPMAAGAGGGELCCVRPDEPGARARRLLLGGCHLLAEPDTLARPATAHQSSEYTYTETGRVCVRYGVVVQRAAGGGGSEGAGPASGGGGGGAAALLVGAEAALRRYRRARARLAHATAAAGAPE